MRVRLRVRWSRLLCARLSVVWVVGGEGESLFGWCLDACFRCATTRRGRDSLLASARRVMCALLRRAPAAGSCCRPVRLRGRNLLSVWRVRCDVVTLDVGVSTVHVFLLLLSVLGQDSLRWCVYSVCVRQGGIDSSIAGSVEHRLCSLGRSLQLMDWARGNSRRSAQCDI